MFCFRKIKTLCCLKVAAAFMSLSLSFFFPLLELFFKFSLNSQEFLGCSWLPLNLASDEKYFILSYQGLSAERDDFWKTLLSTHLQNFLFSFFFYVYTTVKFVLPVMVEGLVNQMFCHHKKSSDGYTKEVTT